VPSILNIWHKTNLNDTLFFYDGNLMVRYGTQIQGTRQKILIGSKIFSPYKVVFVSLKEVSRETQTSNFSRLLVLLISLDNHLGIVT
jgi:hypothetical protein